MATPVFLPGELHGQKNLAGYSPRGCKAAEQLTHTHTHTIKKKKSMGLVNTHRLIKQNREPIRTYTNIVNWTLTKEKKNLKVKV